MMQGEIVIAALVLRARDNQVTLTVNELHEAFLRADDIEFTKDELGNITLKLVEPTLQGVVISDLPMIE